MQKENIFQKKIPQIKTYTLKYKNKNPSNLTSCPRRTNSQILYIHNNLNDDISTNRTKSYKRQSSETVLPEEQMNNNKETTENKKGIPYIKKNTSTSNIQNESSSENILVPKKIEELLKYKNLCEKTIKQLNLSKKNNTSKILDKSELDSNKNSSKHSKHNNTNRSKETYSNNSDNICNYDDINSANLPKKKNLSLKYDNIHNNISQEMSKYNLPMYSKYLKLNKLGKKLNNSNIESKNDFKRLKIKYLNLKNEHNLTLSQLKIEKSKNKSQQEEIENLRNNNLKLNSYNNNKNDDEKNELIKILKEENDTFRKELVLSQALINSLKSEIQCYNINKKFKKMKSNYNEYNNKNKINDNNKINYIDDGIDYNLIDSNKVLKKVEELNIALNKKNEILDSVLIENNRLRKELKINKYPIKYKFLENEKNENYQDVSNLKNIIDLMYNDSLSIINKYEQYQNNNINEYNNLILSEQFFNELKNIKNKIYLDKEINEVNIKKNIIKNYMDLSKLITNEFDKLLLYNNNQFEKTKYFNKYQYNNFDFDNSDDINYKNINLNYNKERHNLMDFCLLCSSYLKGEPKELILEGINIIKSLVNLYDEKNRENDKNNINRIKDLIIKFEEQLENIKRKLCHNDNEYFFDYSDKSINKNKDLTYMINYNNDIRNVNDMNYKNNNDYY